MNISLRVAALLIVVVAVLGFLERCNHIELRKTTVRRAETMVPRSFSYCTLPALCAVPKSGAVQVFAQRGPLR